MATETVTICICDRCGSRSDKADYMKGNSWGKLSVKWNGDKGGRSYQGDAGGINIKGNAWLCQKCTAAFLTFMEPIHD